MNLLNETFTTRHPQLEDAEIVHQLIVANDVAEYGQADTDLEEILHDWSNLDLDQDAWLVCGPDDAAGLLGYASLIKGSHDFRLDFYTHPEQASPGLANYLIDLAEARAQAQLSADTTAGTAAVPLTTISPSVNRANIQAIEQAGFTPFKYHFRMQIDQAVPPVTPTWPAGCTLRTIVAGQDDRLYDFIYRAFDWHDEPPPNFAWWRDFMMRSDHFRPDLWFLLFHETDLIGAALCYDYVDYGWVRQLGVEKSWRRRGLGSDLLRYVFNIFYGQGRPKVALGVEANNLNAVALYERIGMRRVRQYNEYGKHLTAS